jgi:hypothetical protein
MIEATALSEVLHPLQRLIAQLGSEAYVSTKPGSFVLEILPVPQQEMDSTSPRLEAVGETLADLVSAASKENVNDEIAAAMDDLSLDGVRAIKALVKTLNLSIWIWIFDGPTRMGSFDLGGWIAHTLRWSRRHSN